jgi:hypothetical protein
MSTDKFIETKGWATRRFAQQEEKIVNGELQADKKKQ